MKRRRLNYVLRIRFYAFMINGNDIGDSNRRTNDGGGCRCCCCRCNTINTQHHVFISFIHLSCLVIFIFHWCRTHLRSTSIAFLVHFHPLLQFPSSIVIVTGHSHQHHRSRSRVRPFVHIWINFISFYLFFFRSSIILYYFTLIHLLYRMVAWTKPNDHLTE